MAKPPGSSSLLEFDILGLPEVQKALRDSPRRTQKALEAAMHASVHVVKENVQKKLDNDVLQRRSSPGLFGSVNTRVRRNGRAYTGIIGTHLIYARVHEFGAVIRPRSKDGWLQFRTADGGWVRTKRVRIPKRPVWVPAFRESRERIVRIHERELDRMLGEVARAGESRRRRFRAGRLSRFRKGRQRRP